MLNKKTKKILAGGLIVAIGFLLAVLLHVAGTTDLLELKTLDIRFQLSDRDTKANEDIIIVLIDEASLQSMQPLVGRWPWPRSLFADLIDFMTYAEAKAVMFDILFTETQRARSSEGDIGEDDFALVDSTIQSGAIIHAAQFVEDEEDEINKTLLNRPLSDEYVQKNAIAGIQIQENARTESANNYYIPFAELTDAANKIGIVEFRPDSDGVYRRSRLVRGYQGNFFPVLAFTFLYQFWSPESAVLGTELFQLGEELIPLQKDGSYLINMKKSYNTFSIGGIFSSMQKIQAGDLENLLVNPEEFKDKIVIVGASAAGVEDLKHTSTGDDVPGVLLHASILSNLLERDHIKNVPAWQFFPIIFILCLITAIVILRFQSVVIQNSIPVIFILIYLLISYVLFDRYRIWLPVIVALIGLGTVYVGSYIFVSFTEGREKRKTRKMLSQYVSPAVLSEVMDKSDSALTAEVGTSEELSILFSDIRSFTSFSEAVEASQVVEQLNYYLQEMVDLVFEHEGTLDKFIGDAVMAFWGAPIINPAHARHAVMTALDMIDRMDYVNKHFTEMNYPLFKIGVGIHTGKVILGNIGSDKKLDYTVIGDGVNLASRMEGLTKEYGCPILISESTYQVIKGEIYSRIIDSVRVKGKDKPISIYQPLTNPNAKPEEIETGKQMAEQVGEAFGLYQSRQWPESIKMYQEILKIWVDDKSSQSMIERCQEFMESPPPDDWDGCYTMKTK